MTGAYRKRKIIIFAKCLKCSTKKLKHHAAEMESNQNILSR